MKVEREIVGAGNKNETVTEADDQGGDIGEAREEPEGNERVFGDFRAANDCEGAEPVNGFKAGDNGSPWSLDIEEKEEKNECSAITRYL